MDTQAEPTPSDSQSIVLCLSGGGLRATFFHLGVVRLLAEIGWLPRVSDVFSVSGGSILAGHMALHWDSYANADGRAPREASDELLRFAQFDLRGRIVRRTWMLPVGAAKTRLLQHYYERLCRGARLQDLPARPAFHFLATSLTSGQLCSFDRTGWTAVSIGHHGPSFRTPAGDLPLARIVAASSAFPPLFPPVSLRAPGISRHVETGVSDSEWLLETHYLTDGGIFDNLGVAEIRHLLDTEGWLGKDVRGPIVVDGFTRNPIAPAPALPAHIVVSDASAGFSHTVKPPGFRTVVGRTVRSTDILMARLAVLDVEDASRFSRADERWPSHVCHLPIQAVVRPFKTKCGATYRPQAAEIQKLVPLTRTDLDQFDPDLVRSLVRHGHEVAAQTCARLHGQEEELPSDVPWDPQPGHGRTDDGRLVRLLERQHSRFRWQDNLLGIFNPRDPVCWIYAASVIAVVVLVISRMGGW